MAEENLMTPEELVKVETKPKVEITKFRGKKRKKKKKRVTKVFSGIVTPEDYTKEQKALRGFFGGHGDPMWGTGRDLPRVRGDMMQGFGLIKSGDNRRETAGLFGL